MAKEIFDEILLFFMGTLLLATQEITTISVVVWLIVLTVISLCLYFDRRWMTAGLLLLYGAFCLFFSPPLLFLPVICYDGFRRHLPWCLACALLILPWRQCYPLWIWFAVLSGLFISALLSYGTMQNQILSAELIRLRDTAAERDMLQQARTKALLEKQDYEIYLATLQERNRIAREIHDNVGHMLSRSILQMGALATVHQEQPLHEQLLSVNRTLNEAMTSIRQSVHDLHDDAIDLEQAVRDSLRDMQKNYNVTLEYNMSKHIPREVKYCFIAIVKEALSNIIKHSSADSITLRMREHPAFYQMLIEDNGDGSRTEGKGIGLYNMRERVQALGGTLHIRRENGFHIFVTVQKKNDTAIRQENRI